MSFSTDGPLQNESLKIETKCKILCLTLLGIVSTPDQLFMIWYFMMTMFSLAISIILFVSFVISQCNIQIPQASLVTLWIEIIIQSLCKIFTIVFFRYDIVFYRSNIKTVILWRPFILSLLMIGQAPAALLPIYTYNFNICYDRNIIIGLTYSWPI